MYLDMHKTPRENIRLTIVHDKGLELIDFSL